MDEIVEEDPVQVVDDSDRVVISEDLEDVPRPLRIEDLADELCRAAMMDENFDDVVKKY